MPGAHSIPIEKAALALNLDEAGYNPTQIAQQTSLSRPTVYDILGRHGHWGEVTDLPAFNKLRREQNQHLEAGFRAGSAKLLARAFDEDKLVKASTYQLVIASSIAIDKAQLLAGLPTEITASYAIHEIRGLDRIAEALSQTLLDVTESKP